MKNVLQVLAVVLAFTLNVDAAPQKMTTTQSAFTKAKPPHCGYRMGSYYNNIPRYAVRVVANGQVFYRHNGIYFSPYRRGFVVVQQPRFNRVPRYNHGPRYPQRGYRNGQRSGSGYNNGNRNGQGNGQRPGGINNDRRGGQQAPAGGDRGGRNTGNNGSSGKKGNGNKGGRG